MNMPLCTVSDLGRGLALARGRRVEDEVFPVSSTSIGPDAWVRGCC